MFRPCFSARQTFDATSAFSKALRRRDAPRPVRPNGCDQASGCCLFRGMYCDGDDVIPAGI